MTQDDHTLTITFGNPPYKVSALSSLLRSLQAAARETATEDTPDDTLFSSHQGPFLVAQTVTTQGGQLKLQLWFADPDDNPLPETSISIFNRTTVELKRCLLLGSQHTFWGSPSTAINYQDIDERMKRFISNLRTFRNAEIAFRDTAIKLENQIFAVS